MTRKSRIAVGMVVALLLTVQSVCAQKELRKIRLNVFRVDAATVAAKVNGYFAGEGLVQKIFVAEIHYEDFITRIAGFDQIDGCLDHFGALFPHRA